MLIGVYAFSSNGLVTKNVLMTKSENKKPLSCTSTTVTTTETRPNGSSTSTSTTTVTCDTPAELAQYHKFKKALGLQN